MSKKKIVIIGSGFAGLASAACLAQKGYEVTVLEKNDSVGGRARHFSENGFMFDMGPSWYWMPGVFEDFFKLFGKKVSDYYQLKRLSPGYVIHFGDGNTMEVPDAKEDIYNLFESKEKGAGEKLRIFLKDAERKYKISMQDLVFKPSLSITEFFNAKVFANLFKMHLFESFHKYVRRYFTHPDLIKLLEFPILFLGAKPQNTPALYSMMNYAGLSAGTYYPQGGMRKVPEAIEDLAISLGAKIIVNEPASKIEVENNITTGVWAGKNFYPADVVISGADYAFTEQNLLEENYRNYSSNYWGTRTLAPSALIFYLGINKKIEGLHHHTLFFDSDFEVHAHEIYTDPKWPTDPLFYLCCPSVSDAAVAPVGSENLFVLIPLATDIEDNETMRQKYYEIVMQRLEKFSGQSIRNNVVFNKSYCINDFKNDYNALRGNAYGLANTLKQTAVLKPSMRNKKIKNLFYTGQLTVPGPGVPPSLISAQIVSNLVDKQLKK